MSKCICLSLSFSLFDSNKRQKTEAIKGPDLLRQLTLNRREAYDWKTFAEKILITEQIKTSMFSLYASKEKKMNPLKYFERMKWFKRATLQDNWNQNSGLEQELGNFRFDQKGEKKEKRRRKKKK